MSTPASPAAKMETVGILAGNGVYPGLLARRLLKARKQVVVAGIRGQTDEAVRDHCVGFELFSLGAVRRKIAYFEAHRVRRIFFAGGVKRPLALRDLRPDAAGIKLLVKSLAKGDDGLLRAVAKRFEAGGIEVADPRPFLLDMLAAEGLLAGPPPTPAALADLEVARQAAEALGRRDQGQAALALAGEVIGVETKAGTDALVGRARTAGAVLAKMVKPGQDKRFDLPAIGPFTVEAANKAGLAAIGVQAGGVLLLDKAALLDACRRYRISLLGL